MSLKALNFKTLGVGGVFRRALNECGFETPSAVQQKAIPVLLKGRDVLGVAQTGSGKTAAFALPMLQRLSERGRRAAPHRPIALAIVPTRELALQIKTEFDRFGRYAQLSSAAIFGGVGQGVQVKTLRKGVDVVVATPGRLLDLSDQGHLDLSAVSMLVLDEADRLLDMGFVCDVRRIIARTPRSRQSLLFSATMGKAVSSLAADILNDPVRVNVEPKQVTVREVDQRVIMVPSADKRKVLTRLLCEKEVSKAIVFTRTKHGADRLARQLGADGIVAETIHGNKSQGARQRALLNFRKEKAWVLVATDVAARGLDIDAVSHVFNFEMPHEPESYVHRIGRTARAGAAGVACSLVDPSERPRLDAVERLTRSPARQITVTIPEPDGTYRQIGSNSDGSESRRAARKQKQHKPGDCHAKGKGRRRNRSWSATTRI